MNSEREYLSFERLLRVAMAVFVFALVLIMYFGTENPTGDIKYLLIGWTAFGLGCAWLAGIAGGWLRFRRPPVFLLPLLCFLGLYLIASLVSEFPSVGMVEWSRFAALFGLYFIVSQIYNTPAQARRLMLVLCAAVFAAAVYAFMQKAGLDPAPWADRQSDVYTNLPSTYGNPNFAAHTLILAIIIDLYLLSVAWRKAWQRGAEQGLAGSERAKAALRGAWVHLMFLAAFFAHLHYTDQRAGPIGLAVALVLVLIAWAVGARQSRPLRGAVVSLALVAALAVAGGLGAMAVSKWRSGTSVPLDGSLVIRYQSYVSAVDMLLDKPLLGHGPGAYALTYQEYWTPFEQEWFAQEMRMNAHVHNDLMEVAIDAGVPAAGLYLLVLVLGMGYGLVMAFSNRDPGRRRLGYMFTALFAAFLADGMFGFNLRVPVSATVLFVAMGLLDAMRIAEAGAEARAVPQRFGLAFRAALAVLLLVAAVFITRMFGGQYYLYQGKSFQFNEERRSFPTARAMYNSGYIWAPWEWQFPWWLGRLSLYELEANRDPGRAEEYLNRARARLQEALEVNPHAFMVYPFLAETEMKLAQLQMLQDPPNRQAASEWLDMAADDLEAMLEVCPVFAKAHELLGRVACDLAAYLTAEKDPERADELEAHWRNAEEHLLRAIEYELENQSEMWRTLAQVRIALNDTVGAEQALASAMDADPTDMRTGPMFLNFAKKHDRFERVRNALYTQLHRLRETDEPDAEALSTAYLTLANVMENGYQDLDAADEAYLDAVESAPDAEVVWANLGRYAFQHDRLDLLRNAVAQASGQLAAEGKAPPGQVAAVNAVLQGGAEKLGDASALLMANVRNASGKKGAINPRQRFGWAARMLLQMLPDDPAMAPGQCKAYLNMAIVFAGLDRVQVADRLFRRAEQCLEGSERAFLSIHWADTLLRLGRMQEALDRLRAAREGHADNLDLRWALARTLVKAELVDEARSEYEALLERTDIAERGRAMLEQELAALQARIEGQTAP